MASYKRKKYLVMLIVLICIALTSCNGKNDEETGYTDKDTDKITDKQDENNEETPTVNIDNTINLEEWIYFGNPDDNYKIYKIKTNGTGLMKLEDARFEGFGDLEEWIYFVDTNEKYTPAKLARVKWDGSNKEIISEENVDDFCMSNDYVFYVFENNIYRMDKDGTSKTKIVSIDDKIYAIKFYKDTIYFNTNKGLYSINSDGKDLYCVLEGNFYEFDISNDQIYYYDDKIYSSSLEGMNERQIFELDFTSIFMANNAIYYNQDDYFYKTGTGDKKVENIFVEQYLNNFYEKDNYIYFYGSNRIWKVKKDLSEKEIFIGNGQEHNQKMYVKVGDKIVSKNYDYEDYINGDLSYKLYELTNDEIGKKISDVAVDIFDSNNDMVYYTDAKDKKLYSMDINTSEKQLVIDKTINSFITDDKYIFYTDINDNYHLYRLDSQNNHSTIITNTPVSNIKKSGDSIYFLNNKRIGILEDRTNNVSRYINVFTTVYDILDKYIYYKNEDDEGKLYRIKTDGTDQIKLSDNKIKDIYTYKDKVYYVEENGTNLLYRITNSESKGEFLDLISIDYIDMEIIDGVVYICNASEGGVYYTVEKYLADLNYKVSYDITKQIDGNWKYFVYDIYNFMGYLYKYNTQTNEIELIIDNWVSDFEIVDGWLYYTGNINNGEYYPYIDRINLKTSETNSIVTIQDPHIYDLSYKVLKDYIYYFLEDSSEGIIWKKSLIDGTQTIIVDNASSLEDIEDDWLYYQNNEEEKKIYRVKLDGSKKEMLTNSNSKYIHSNKNELYYLSITEEGSYKGLLIKKTFHNNVEQIMIGKELSSSDLVVVNHTLYYNDKGINKYNLKTGTTSKIYNKEVDYFILTGNILYCSIYDGEKFETIEIPIE